MRTFLLIGCSPLRVSQYPCRFSSILRNISHGPYGTKNSLVKNSYCGKSIFFKQFCSKEKIDRFSKFSDLIQRNLSKVGIQVDRKALKRNIKIVVALYVLLSLLVFSGIYCAIGYGCFNSVEKYLEKYPSINNMWKKHSRFLTEKSQDIERENYSNEIYYEAAKLKQSAAFMGKKLVIAYGIYKVFAIPKLIIFSIIVGGMFMKKRKL